MSNSILNSIIEITGQRDLDSLEYSLAATLAELIPIKVIIIHKLTERGPSDTLQQSLKLEISRDSKGELDYQWCTDPKVVPKGDLLQQAVPTSKLSSLDGASELSKLAVQISGDGKVLGAISLESREIINGHLSLIEAMVRIYENYLTILNESERDKLTGLLNRRTFDHKLNRLLEIQRKQTMEYGQADDGEDERRQCPLGATPWLVTLDIDHFKSVNDDFGHVVGDEILIMLARLMKESFRFSDQLFRFGGEEFVIVLEPVSEEMAQQILERFRKKVADNDFPQVGQVTVSFGYAKISEDDYPPYVLECADKALYYAKENGRNQVFNYETLVEQGKLKPLKKSGTVDLF